METSLLITVVIIMVAVVLLVRPVRLLVQRRGGRGQEIVPYDPSPGDRFDHLWGYTDTRFEFTDEQTVRVTGTRYPLAGAKLPRFVGFVEQILVLPIHPDLERKPVLPENLPQPVRNEPFLEALGAVMPVYCKSADDNARLTHSHGQLSVDEIYRIMTGHAPARLVDLVVYPGNEIEVQELVRLAGQYDVVLIPYGGGTNVSGALLCPIEERRMIVSVDMRRMNRVLEIDRSNNRVVVEAGITGKELERQLAEAGLTCGHVPDSIEFSTLGGWIATNASGMKKNRYGNIEDIVLDAVMISGAGEVHSLPVAPRTSLGIQPRHFLFGSEGGLGIITRAVLQVRPVPETCRYASFVFPDFSDGLCFLKAVQDAEIRPASIRLASNMEFRLGQALGRQESRRKALASRAKAFYLLRIKGFHPERMVAGTVLMEGSRTDVERQWKALSRLLRESGGLSGGEENGRRGYQVTFAIAYIRDFLNSFDILGETFETSAPWDRVEALVAAVESELHRLGKVYGVPGRPYLSYRISQSYQTGVCIYFTLGFCGRGLAQADSVYQAIEQRLREVVLDYGGSLSHHHGIGKVRQQFIGRVYSDSAIRAIRGIKQSIDPGNIFAAGNHVFGRQFGGQVRSADNIEKVSLVDSASVAE